MPRRIRQPPKPSAYSYKRERTTRRQRLSHKINPPAPADHKVVAGKEVHQAITEYRWLRENFRDRPRLLAQAIWAQAEASRAALYSLQLAYTTDLRSETM